MEQELAPAQYSNLKLLVRELGRRPLVKTGISRYPLQKLQHQLSMDCEAIKIFCPCGTAVHFIWLTEKAQ